MCFLFLPHTQNNGLTHTHRNTQESSTQCWSRSNDSGGGFGSAAAAQVGLYCWHATTLPSCVCVCVWSDSVPTDTIIRLGLRSGKHDQDILFWRKCLQCCTLFIGLLYHFQWRCSKRIKEAAGQSVRSDKCVDGRSVNGLMSRWLWHQWTQCASCLSRAPQGYFPLQFISSFFVSLKKKKQKQSDCHDRKCFGAALWTLAAGWQLCFVLNVANKNGIRSST